MKYGFRTPSIKRSISARTTGRLKRSVKKSVIPFYGQKGVGLITNPKKAAYNYVYHRVTFGGLSDISHMFAVPPSKKSTAAYSQDAPSIPLYYANKGNLSEFKKFSSFDFNEEQEKVGYWMRSFYHLAELSVGERVAAHTLLFLCTLGLGNIFYEILIARSKKNPAGQAYREYIAKRNVPYKDYLQKCAYARQGVDYLTEEEKIRFRPLWSTEPWSSYCTCILNLVPKVNEALVKIGVKQPLVLQLDAFCWDPNAPALTCGACVYEEQGLTPKGNLPKYKAVLEMYLGPSSGINTDGVLFNVSLLQSGEVGKGSIKIWTGENMIQINLNNVENSLNIKDIYLKTGRAKRQLMYEGEK